MRNLFLRVSPRSETELDRDGVFLRYAFEREKNSARQRGPPRMQQPKQPGEGGRVKERGDSLGATSLFSLAISDRLRDGSPRLLLCPVDRHSSFSRSVASHACICRNCARGRVMNERHGVARRDSPRCCPYGRPCVNVRLVHDEWSQDEGMQSRQCKRRNRKRMHERKRETELLCAEAARLLYVKRNMSVYSRILRY